MVGIDDVYTGGGGGNLFRAADLKNKDLELVIDGYEIRKFGEKTKVVLSFKGSEKRLALNVTNALTLGRAYGKEDIDKWLGKKVVIYLGDALYQGKMVDSVMVRIPRATRAATTAETYSEVNPPPIEEGEGF